MDDELLAYYDEIRRLAEAKSDSREEAEDLLSETFLAAFAYRHNGGVIEHPKTYLVHTLMHKRNSLLRRKYRLPKVVSLQTLPEDAADDFTAAEEAYERTEEAAALRRTLLYLSETTREVLLRYYFNGNSVADIAEQLGIPAGTVKSRLSAGREAVRKGLTNRMNETKNRIPDRLHLYAGGAMGPRDEPMSLVEGDLIAQNLLIAAYDKPLTITELAARLSVPTVYLEPIVRRLTDGELMRRDGQPAGTPPTLSFSGRRTTAGASTRSLRSCANTSNASGAFWRICSRKSTRRRFAARSRFGADASWSATSSCGRCKAFSFIIRTNRSCIPSGGTAGAGLRWDVCTPAAAPRPTPTEKRASMSCMADTERRAAPATAAARRISSSASLIRRCGTVPAALQPAATTRISERCRSFCGVCIRASRLPASATRCWSAWTR